MEIKIELSIYNKYVKNNKRIQNWMRLRKNYNYLTTIFNPLDIIQFIIF